MKLARRAEESISIAFLDVITCGIGAIILLLMISKPPPAAPPADDDDPRVARIAGLQRELFTLQDRAAALETELAASAPELRALAEDTQRAQRSLADARLRAQGATEQAAREAAEKGRLQIAQQQLSAEMARLYAQRKRAKVALIGGVPIDSEYLVFIIDSSESMTRYAWDKLRAQMLDTLVVYPRLKGVQIMNDQGVYMFEESRGRWLTDSPVLRNRILDALPGWHPYSASSPTAGIHTALEDLYRAEHRISLFVLGDELTDKSVGRVLREVDALGLRDAQGRSKVRVHAVGFPTQFANGPSRQETGIRFAALMRELTHRYGGTFVGLNAFR